MNKTAVIELKPGTPDLAQAECYADLENLASGGGTADLYGRYWRNVVTQLYREEGTLQSHENTIMAWADGRPVGQVTYVFSNEYDRREKASHACARRVLGRRALRPAALRTLRHLTGQRLGPSECSDIHCCSLAVLPEWRRHGIASKLMSELERRARDTDATCLSLDVSPRNEGAVAFYTRHGFHGEQSGRPTGRILHFQKQLPQTATDNELLSDTVGLRHDYEQNGFVGSCFQLAEPRILPQLLKDLPQFRTACEDYAKSGQARVPYLMSDAVRRTAHDPNIIRLVTALLKTDDWVMWGGNIREATPNEAHLWHVDLESWLWPSVTVAVGVAGASPDAATQFIPGSHKWSRAPGPSQQDADFSDRVRRIEGFADGRFYAFNARAWHRGDPGRSRARVALFLHYQRASDPRIPEMLDYKRHKWSRMPAPFISAPGATPRRDIYALPLRYQTWRVLSGLRARIG